MQYFSFETEAPLREFLLGITGAYHMFQAPDGKFWVVTDTHNEGGTTDPTKYRQALAAFFKQHQPKPNKPT